jgi:heme A synthase
METGVIVIVSVLGGLLAFGVLYDQFVAWLERTGRDRGITALLVVAGTLATLVGMGILDVFIDLNAFLLGLACFSASGAPMTVGSLWRAAQQRAEDERKAQQLAQELLDDKA